MLSSTAPQNKSVISAIKREMSTRNSPGIIHRIFNKVDKRTTAYSMSTYDPTVQL